MIDYNNFNDTMKIGSIGETRIVEMLNFIGYEGVELSEGYQPDYDIKYIDKDNSISTIEVKTCMSHYPNIAIEFQSRGKPSGIYSTKADIFAVYRSISDVVYFGDTNKILEYIQSNDIKVRCNKRNNTDTKIYIIPESQWPFHKIDLNPLNNPELNYDTGKEIILEIAQ
jgi:hypothetical protein